MSDLLDRLEASYTVQEQEAAEHIRKIENALLTIKKLVEGDLFFSTKNILDVIKDVLDDGD